MNRISAKQPLSDDDHQMLSAASLFEEEFSIDWIQELTSRKASEVLSCCDKALRLGLLSSREIGTFSFCDHEKRLALQGRLLSAQSQVYHKRIFALLSRELPDTKQKALRLAPHLLSIENTPESCLWLLNAARSYASDYSIQAALACYGKILEDLSGAHSDQTDELFCDAAIEYARLNTARSDVKKVTSILEDAMFRAKNLHNERYQSLIGMNFAKNKWLQSQYKSALKHFEDSWTLANSLGDETLIRSLDNFKTFLLYWQGLFKDALVDYEIHLTDVEKFPQGRFPLLATMTVGVCYGQTGQVTQGIGMIDAIRRQCLETGDRDLAAHCGICIGAILLDIGHIEDALSHLVSAGEETQTLPPDWTMLQGELILAYACYLHGENEASVKHIRQYFSMSKLADVTVRPWSYVMELGFAAEQGHYPALPDLSLQQEIDAAMRGENVFLKGVACRFQALLQKREGAAPETLIETLKKSVKFLERAGHAIELAKTRLELARAYLLKGQPKQAIKVAANACEVLSELNETLIPDDLKGLVGTSGVGNHQLQELLAVTRELTLAQNSRDVIGQMLSAANRISGAERGGIFLLEHHQDCIISGSDETAWSKPSPRRKPGSSLNALDSGFRRNDPCNTESEMTGHFVLRASKNLTEEQIHLPEFSASKKLMADVFASGKGMTQDLRISDNPDAPGTETVLSCICVPLLAGGRVLGVLYADNRLLSNVFNASHLDAFNWLAAYAAQVMDNDRLQKENEQLTSRVEEIRAYYEAPAPAVESVFIENIIGQGDAIKKVLSQIAQIAPTDTSVLLLGETGVGKEIAAQAILNLSRRKDKPFIALHCSALSEKLIYSELFGHEKGSFTGADRRHIGRFEKAHTGTLFLDEIGDLPQEMQVRLLRVLETKTFERVGGKETLSSDFRLICATNRNLEAAIKRKLFRADLFYRINVFPIVIPPLRERLDDIPLLVNYFLKRQAEKTGHTPRMISKEDMERLLKYDWPGNVRELKNCVERYVASPKASMADLLETRLPRSTQRGKPAVTLADNERRHIEWALQKTAGKISGPGGAAELLDIHPNTLTFRMKKLGIRK